MSRRNRSRADTPAGQLAERLGDALRHLARALPDGARDLALVRGIGPGGNFMVPLEAVLADLRQVFVPPDGPFRVFLYSTSVVMEMLTDGREPALVTLSVGVRVESVAAGCLANLVVCVLEKPDGPPVQYPLPRQALAVVLTAEPLLAALPRIRLYARRPVYSHDFVLLGPGYHREYEVLVHGPAVEPDLAPLPRADDALARLPRHLRTLLAGFCFASPADLANFVGLMLTGLLVHHFVEHPKALALVDGNQAGVGKSLLMQVLGMVLDGATPHIIHFTDNEEELQKRVCATLRPGTQSVLVLDNAKKETGGAVSSPTLEANSVAPVIALRILGTSTNFVRPNDVIWGLTMNQTSVSGDLASRGVPIRLSYAGPPEARTFAGPDPLEYAREHRLDLLGELTGCVERWKAAGQPYGLRPHRCTHWAKVIGGVLSANGFPEFLQNYAEAAGMFTALNDELTALFDTVLKPSSLAELPVYYTPDGSQYRPGPNKAERGWPATRWADLFTAAGVRYATGEPGTSERGRGVQIGRWFSARVNRPVAVVVNGHRATARLEQVSLRAHETRYVVVVTFDSNAGEARPVPLPAVTPAPAIPPAGSAWSMGAGSADGNGGRL